MPRYVVRCGVMRVLYAMQSLIEFQRGDKVVTTTTRGTEIGEILCEATPNAMSGVDSAMTGNVLRKFSDTDQQKLDEIAERLPEMFGTTRASIESEGLEMDVIDVEFLFGGEKFVVYYLAEDRVDFRSLIRTLGQKLGTRIDMRHVGVRDEAKLLADYGDCGKPVCCNTHLTKMPPVTMKMARLQKATLDPNKISGRCGRLKCCLRYEYDTYEDNLKRMPKIGSDVVTREGRGRVVAQELLAEQLLLEMEDHRKILIHNDEVLSILKKGKSEDSKPRGSRSKNNSKRKSKPD